MEECRNLVLSTGIQVSFDNDFVERLTLLCIKYNVLQPCFKNRPMSKEQQNLLCVIATLLNIMASGDDMNEILRWLRRVIYDKARRYTSEEEWLKEAPEWLCRAATYLHLRPTEQLPQPADKLMLSASATRALLRRVHDTRMKLQDPVLELIWEGVCRAPMTKLDLLLKAGDLSNGCGGTLTDLEWRIVDLVLLHSDENQHPVVTDESLKVVAQRMALVTTYELAREHHLDGGASRSELARRWGRAYREYIDKGFHLSLVVLQRRWYELRRRALSLRSCEPRESRETRESGLLAQVEEYAVTSPGALYSWPDLVGGGMVFTYQEVVESEIISATPEWKVDCGTDVSMTENENLAATEEIPGETMEVKPEPDEKDCVVEEERVGVGGDSTESSAPLQTNWALPAKTGRISSLLLFESDDEDISPDNSTNSNIASLEIDPQKVTGLLGDTVETKPQIILAKELKEEIDCVIPTILDAKIKLLENISHALELNHPLPDIVKQEPEELSLKIVKVETDYSESISLYPGIQSKVVPPTLEAAPSLNHIMVKEEIDPKLLMETKILVEKLDFQKYKEMRKKVSRSTRCMMDVDEEQDSSRDSGDVWVPSGESDSESSCDETYDGRAEEALRPVTLRDIDQVRRDAQRKLTAQVAPVTPASPATPATPTTTLLTQENDIQEGQLDSPLSDSDADTGAQRIVVEVTQYCPFGLKSTRLRYGEGMYRRELDAAAVAMRKRMRDKRIAAKAAKRKMEVKQQRSPEQLPRKRSRRLRDKPPEEPVEKLGDDMSEWIRQRNLNSRYFSLGLTKDISQRRRSNPTLGGDKPDLKHKTRATSLGKESAPTATTSSPAISTPISVEAQDPHLTSSLVVSKPITTGPVTSAPSSSAVIRIIPTMQLQYQPGVVVDTPSTSESTSASVAQLVFTNPPWITNQLPSNSLLLPVKIVSLPPESEVSPEVINVQNNVGDSSATEPRDDGNSENNKLKAIENTSTSGKEGLEPIASTETSPVHPPVTSPPNTFAAVFPEIFGNSRTVLASDYIKDEDGSRLKVICKERATPFWIIAGEYIMLAEEPCHAMLCRASYYTLAPPNEIKRIVFDTYRPPSDEARGSAHAGPAPPRMCVQGKVYRKLSSAPLRYAQVLYAVRSVQHARRIMRRGRAVLVYSACTRNLTPLQNHTHFLNIYDKDAIEEIVIDD